MRKNVGKHPKNVVEKNVGNNSENVDEECGQHS
jgi:hypothetical protein